MLWVAMSGERGLIGPHFFEDHDGHACSVNSERYIAMLREFCPQTQKSVECGAWNESVEDRATAHIAMTSVGTLNTKLIWLAGWLADRLISLNPRQADVADDGVIIIIGIWGRVDIPVNLRPFLPVY